MKVLNNIEIGVNYLKPKVIDLPSAPQQVKTQTNKKNVPDVPAEIDFKKSKEKTIKTGVNHLNSSATQREKDDKQQELIEKKQAIDKVRKRRLDRSLLASHENKERLKIDSLIASMDRKEARFDASV